MINLINLDEWLDKTYTYILTDKTSDMFFKAFDAFDDISSESKSEEKD